MTLTIDSERSSDVNFEKIHSKAQIIMTSYLTSVDTISLYIFYRSRKNAGQFFEGRTQWRNLTF